MKHYKMVLITLLILVIGCAENGPVALDLVEESETVYMGKKGVKYVPYKGEWTGWFDDAVDLGVECGGLFMYPASHEGTATHSGHTTVASNHCLDFSTGIISNGYAVATAANGDLQYWSYEGWADLVNGPFWLELELIGGTGRFVHATSMNVRHEGTSDGATLAYTTTGMISSVGSSE